MINKETIKQFLKPDKKKIVITIVLIILSILSILVQFYSPVRFMESEKAVPLVVVRPKFNIPLIVLLYLPIIYPLEHWEWTYNYPWVCLIFAICYFYIISCLIVCIWNKIKNRKHENDISERM